MESLMLFALLPLGLFSLFTRRLPRSTAGFGFLAALAPVIASGLGSLIKGKQQSSAAKKQAEYEKQQALAAEAANKASWEAQQNSPAAQMQRMGFNMKLGRLLGAMGGREKVPPSLLNALDASRAMPTYTPGAAYVDKPSSGSGWDVAAGAADALSYLDTSKIGRTPKISSNLQSIGNQAARSGGLGALQGGGMATSLSGGSGGGGLSSLNDKLKQLTLSSGQKITPFDPKIGRG